MSKIDAALSRLEKLSDKLLTLSESTGPSLQKDTASRLRDKLGELKEAISEITRENENLKGEVRWLRSKVAGAGDFKMRGTVYYTNSGDGPFCPFCYENRSRKIRLMELPPDSDGMSLYKCRVCEGTFKKK